MPALIASQFSGKRNSVASLRRNRSSSCDVIVPFLQPFGPTYKYECFWIYRHNFPIFGCARGRANRYSHAAIRPRLCSLAANRLLAAHRAMDLGPRGVVVPPQCAADTAEVEELGPRGVIAPLFGPAESEGTRRRRGLSY